jgi:hypothetical protein
MVVVMSKMTEIRESMLAIVDADVVDPIHSAISLKKKCLDREFGKTRRFTNMEIGMG